MDSHNHHNHHHSNVRIDAPIIKITIYNRIFTGLLDTCSRFTLAGRPLIRYLRSKGEPTIPTSDSDARYICHSEPLIPREEGYIKFQWADKDVRHKTIYIPELICDLILGRDFMRHCDISIHPRKFGYSFGRLPSKIYKFDSECDNCTYRPSWKSFFGNKQLPRVLKEGTQSRQLPKELIPKEKQSTRTPARFFRKRRRHSDSDSDSDESSSSPPAKKSPTKNKVDSGDPQPSVSNSVSINDDNEAEVISCNCNDCSKHVCGNDLTNSANNNNNGLEDNSMEVEDIDTFQIISDKRVKLLDVKSKHTLEQINGIYDFLNDDTITSTVRNAFNRKVQELLVENRKVKAEIDMLKD